MKWSPIDSSSAISLRSVSLKAYKYIRANNYPFSAFFKFTHMDRIIFLNEGVLGNILKLMSIKALDMVLVERLCVKEM